MPKHTYSMNEKGTMTTATYGNLNISGDEELGFRPYFLMTSAIVGCTSGTLRMVLDDKGHQVEDMDVLADVTRIVDEANRIEAIHLTFKVQCNGLTKEELETAMKETYEKSSMFQSVKDSIKITDTLELVDNL